MSPELQRVRQSPWAEGLGGTEPYSVETSSQAEHLLPPDPNLSHRQPASPKMKSSTETSSNALPSSCSSFEQNHLPAQKRARRLSNSAHSGISPPKLTRQFAFSLPLPDLGLYQMRSKVRVPRWRFPGQTGRHCLCLVRKIWRPDRLRGAGL